MLNAAYLPELSTGRMEPGSGRVGSGHDYAGFCGSRRVSTSDFKVFTDNFLNLESIWIFEYCIRIDWYPWKSVNPKKRKLTSPV